MWNVCQENGPRSGALCCGMLTNTSFKGESVIPAFDVSTFPFISTFCLPSSTSKNLWRSLRWISRWIVSSSSGLDGASASGVEKIRALIYLSVWPTCNPPLPPAPPPRHHHDLLGIPKKDKKKSFTNKLSTRKRSFPTWGRWKLKYAECSAFFFSWAV